MRRYVITLLLSLLWATASLSQGVSWETAIQRVEQSSKEYFDYAVGGQLRIGASKLQKTGSEAGHFLSGATTNTIWLDDPLVERCLSASSTSLSAFKRGKATIYLVLPFEALGTMGASCGSLYAWRCFR